MHTEGYFTRLCKKENRSENIEILLNLLHGRASAQVDTVANTSRHSERRVLHNVAITVRAIWRVVHNGQRVMALGRRRRRSAQRHRAAGQRAVHAHRQPLRLASIAPITPIAVAGANARGRGRGRGRGRLRAGGRAARRPRRGGHGRRLRPRRRDRHARCAGTRPVRAVQAARRARPRHTRTRVKVRRLCWPVTLWLFRSTCNFK